MDEGGPRLADLFPEASRLGAALVRSGHTVAVAESCTGGLLGAVLTSVPGSSRYMLGGVIAYANGIKIAMLDVPEELIHAHGAVSEEVAQAMADGVRHRCRSALGIAITGVAGPGGGSATRPAGLIHVAVAGPMSAMATATLEGDAGREPNRARAVRAALALCLEAVG